MAHRHREESAGGEFAAVAAAAAPRLYRMAVRICGRAEDAEDLVQDTLLQAFRKWPQFEGRSEPTTWLYTIAVRLCHRRRRRRAGEPTRLESLSDLQPGPSDRVLVDARPTGPFDAQLRREAEQAVTAALATLPEAVRLPLVLVDIAELTSAEAARVLGLKEATVKTRVHRARLAIRRRLLQSLPTREAPPPDHERQLCLDLLRAKQEALDRHAEFPLSGTALCARCQSLFATLDYGRDLCAGLSGDALPATIKALLMPQTAGSEAQRTRRRRIDRQAT